MTVGERIAQKRKEHHLSMESLGDMLGVGKSAINKWEKGYVERISRDQIFKMANIFDCDPAWLGGYSENEQIEFDSISPDKEVFSPEDRELLNRYHNASPEDRAIVDLALKRSQQKP